MSTRVAALKGTAVEYMIHLAWVSIRRQDGEMNMMSHDVFRSEYTRLSHEKAALNEDCIEYTIYRNPNKYLIHSLYEGTYIVILRNFKDMLKPVSYDDFIKHYEV